MFAVNLIIKTPDKSRGPSSSRYHVLSLLSELHHFLVFLFFGLFPANYILLLVYILFDSFTSRSIEDHAYHHQNCWFQECVVRACYPQHSCMLYRSLWAPKHHPISPWHTEGWSQEAALACSCPSVLTMSLLSTVVIVCCSSNVFTKVHFISSVITRYLMSAFFITIFSLSASLV